MSYFWFEINFLIGIYLLGSLPVGLILSKMFHTPNPRSHGSGNIGTTNMFRTGGKAVGIATFILDFLKGLAAVYLTYHYLPNLYQLAGMIVVIGHIFPIWLLFKGGKGVAPTLGVLVAWEPTLAFACFVTWLVILFTTRYVSAASLAATFIAPVASYVLHDKVYLLAILVLTALITFSHRENIRRLLNGKEPQIGKKANNESSPQ